MKSTYTMDSKYKFEGRISLPRRRVATKTCSENGDFEMELSLAIRESLKYARENEMKLKQMESTNTLLNGVRREESLSCVADKMLNLSADCDKNEGQGQAHEGNEIQQLKDLLLIHIELIQQQQELLTNKDREIAALRSEKDSLLWRLQKVEKRMAQMKQKEDLLEKQIASAKHFGKASEVAGTSGLPEKIKAEKLEQTPSRKRKRQQHSKPGPPSKVKRYTAQSDKPSDSPTLGEEDSGTENSDTTEEDDTENEYSVEGKSANNIPHKELLRTDSEEEGESEEVEEKEEEEDRDPHPKPVLRTECLYHVSCCVEQLQEESMDVPEDASEKDVITGDQVETPGWRINVLTNRYQLEGTENITDEAYQKRHQKHELEEKRRKRWDIQRLREQRVFEKLRGKEQAAASSVENCQALKTFLPCIEDLTHIEISESVPVMAFGRPIPPIHASEFELPWDTSPPIRKSQGRGGRQK